MRTVVTKEVIEDLMPLYLANEASPATRALVDEFLKLNPEHRSGGFSLEFPSDPGAPADLDRRMIERAQKLNERHGLFLWGALACSYSVFSFRFKGKEIVFQIYRDLPALAWALLLIALALWVAFVVTSRELQRTGLLGSPRSAGARSVWAVAGAAALLPYSFVTSVQTGWELTGPGLAVGAFTGMAIGASLGFMPSGEAERTTPPNSR